MPNGDFMYTGLWDPKPVVSGRIVQDLGNMNFSRVVNGRSVTHVYPHVTKTSRARIARYKKYAEDIGRSMFLFRDCPKEEVHAPQERK